MYIQILSLLLCILSCCFFLQSSFTTRDQATAKTLRLLNQRSAHSVSLSPSLTPISPAFSRVRTDLRSEYSVLNIATGTSDSFSALASAWIRNILIDPPEKNRYGQDRKLHLLTGVPGLVVLINLLVFVFKRFITWHKEQQASTACEPIFERPNQLMKNLPGCLLAAGSSQEFDDAQIQIVLQALQRLERQIEQKFNYLQYRKREVKSRRRAPYSLLALPVQQECLFPVDYSNLLEFWEVEDRTEYPEF
nr:PREDICTED: uncharacterized protein LOC106702698 [Latimeria chalumnae]|eukprot:XP_014341159.1 PREDICTED: uncharacterized protein LOC106702698 [Latimeria chalumnae]